jgi:hypothetical protein
MISTQTGLHSTSPSHDAYGRVDRVIFTKMSCWYRLGATTMHNETQRTKEADRATALLKRIKQLGDKSTQVLFFLSFAFVAIIALESQGIVGVHENSLKWAIRFWALAVPFILLGVLPVRDAVDYAKNKVLWYEGIRWIKCGGPMMVIERLTAAQIQLRSPPALVPAAA